MNKLSSLMILSLCAGSLSACSLTRETFDFSKKSPDEFAIVTRAPLEMPTELNQLPAPRPGIARPQEQSADTQAKQALFGEDKAVGNELTAGESILLQKTGATQVDPNIRNVVDTETQQVVKDSTSTFNKILGKAGKEIDAPASVVDPIKESQRIQQNKAAGKPVTDGETPTIKE